MLCAGKADDVLVLGLDLWFNVFSLKVTLYYWRTVLFFFSFFCCFFLQVKWYTQKHLTMAINTDAANMRGWLGGAMVLGSFKCRGVLLHLNIVGQGPPVLAAGAGWLGCFFIIIIISSYLSYLPILMHHLFEDGWTYWMIVVSAVITQR